MRADGKIAKTVYTGSGVKSIEWIDPPKKGGAKHKTETKAETKETKKD
jgi:hypothetical protein